MQLGNVYSVAVFLSLIAFTAGGWPSSLLAQVQDGILPHKQYCEKQERALNDHESGPDYRQAISNMQSCPSMASKALVAQWNRKHTDAIALEILGRITPLIRDQNLFDAAARVAADGKRPRNERLAAFTALAGYYDSKMSISYTDQLDQPGLMGFAYVRIGRTSAMLTEGMNPLRADAQSRALRIFANAANNDADPTIRSIALFLSEILTQMN